MQPYFGLKGTWLTFWVTVACCTDMALFGYDQGVFSGVNVSRNYLDLMVRRLHTKFGYDADIPAVGSRSDKLPSQHNYRHLWYVKTRETSTSARS